MIEIKRSVEELEYFPKTEEMSFWIERDHPILSMMNLKKPTIRNTTIQISEHQE